MFFPGEQAQEAVDFYVSLVPGSKIISTHRTGEAGPGPKGSVITIEFTLDGKSYVALNGKPEQIKFNESVSLALICDSQAEVDGMWDKILQNGGQTLACGWIRDRFGFCWQVVPADFSKYVFGPAAAGRDRAMKAMMGMIKLDLAELKAAYEG